MRRAVVSECFQPADLLTQATAPGWEGDIPADHHILCHLIYYRDPPPQQFSPSLTEIN